MLGSSFAANETRFVESMIGQSMLLAKLNVSHRLRYALRRQGNEGVGPHALLEPGMG